MKINVQQTITNFNTTERLTEVIEVAQGGTMQWLIEGHDEAEFFLVFDNGGADLVVGDFIDVPIRYAVSFEDWAIYVDTTSGDATGSITLDLRRCTHAQYDKGVTHPVAGDSICAGNYPAVTAGVKGLDTTLNGWDVACNQDDVVRVIITAVADVKVCVFVPGFRRPAAPITTGWLWRGGWDSGTAYDEHDVVESAGSTYICIADNTNQIPPNVTYWELIAARSE